MSTAPTEHGNGEQDLTLVLETEQVRALRDLAEELPMNDFGLPTGIYRTDMLPFHDYVPPDAPHHIESEPPENLGHLLPAPSDVDSSAVHDADVAPPATEPIPHSNGVHSREGSPLPPKAREYRIAGFKAVDIHRAFVPLVYDEGFPAFEDGRAFWSRLDFEPTDAFAAFDRYKQMTFGRRADEEDEDDYGIAAEGARTLQSLVMQMYPTASDIQILTTLQRFQEYYYLYYWGLRAKAYDLFRVAEHRRRQELRAIETQDDHYLQARKLRARVAHYMNSEEDFWDMMTPKVAVDLLKVTTSLERISAGLPAGGPARAGEDESGGRSFQMTLRTIAQTQNASQEHGGTTVDESGNILSQALDDPRATEILQELIIKSGG